MNWKANKRSRFSEGQSGQIGFLDQNLKIKFLNNSVSKVNLVFCPCVFGNFFKIY